MISFVVSGVNFFGLPTIQSLFSYACLNLNKMITKRKYSNSYYTANQ